MQRTVPAFYTPFRIVSYVVIASMLGSIGYAAYIAVIYWTGIRV